MLTRSEHDIGRRLVRLGLLVALAVVAIGAVFGMNWKYLPIGIYVGVAAAWASAIRRNGVSHSCSVALRSMLTGVVSLLTTGMCLLGIVAIICMWQLVVVHRFDVDACLNDVIPNRTHAESPGQHSLAFTTCIVVASAFGGVAGLATWFVASRRWAALGYVGAPLIWLSIYWSETFKSGYVVIPTRVPFVGTLDGGLFMLYLSTIWVAVGGWFGDCRRIKKSEKQATTMIAPSTDAE